mmetsp:Transcript_48254/g.114359  ORF Transcript_48254/g.114359 Transcript_48254/m.114359 type:complete len:225 (+) Transcript_48254:350-1024(+)
MPDRLRDLDVGFGLGHLVLRRDRQDPVRVQVESHVHFRDPALGAFHALDHKVPEQVVARHLRALSLIDVDVDLGLVVVCCRERLRFAARDRRVPLDNHAHDLPFRLDPERQRRDVHQHQRRCRAALDRARQDRALHSGADCNGLVGVDALAEFFAAKVLREHGLDLGDARRATDEHDVAHFRGRDFGVLHHRLDGVDALDEVALVQRVELGARQRHLEVHPLKP